MIHLGHHRVPGFHLLGFVALMSVDTQHLLLFVQVVLQFLHLRFCGEVDWSSRSVKRQELQWACLESRKSAYGAIWNLHKIARFLWYSNILDSLAGNTLSLCWWISPCPVAQLSSSSRHTPAHSSQSNPKKCTVPWVGHFHRDNDHRSLPRHLLCHYLCLREQAKPRFKWIFIIFPWAVSTHQQHFHPFSLPKLKSSSISIFVRFWCLKSCRFCLLNPIFRFAPNFPHCFSLNIPPCWRHRHCSGATGTRRPLAPGTHLPGPSGWQLGNQLRRYGDIFMVQRNERHPIKLPATGWKKLLPWLNVEKKTNMFLSGASGRTDINYWCHKFIAAPRVPIENPL